MLNPGTPRASIDGNFFGFTRIFYKYVFYKNIVIVLQDGVIVGNYRCGLAGRDLNRQYRSPLKAAFPSVWYTKSLVRRCVS